MNIIIPSNSNWAIILIMIIICKNINILVNIIILNIINIQNNLLILTIINININLIILININIIIRLSKKIFLYLSQWEGQSGNVWYDREKRPEKWWRQSCWVAFTFYYLGNRNLWLKTGKQKNGKRFFIRTNHAFCTDRAPAQKLS